MQMGELLPNIVQFFAAQLPVVCRAGYRSAEDLPGQDSAALGDHLRQPQLVEQLVDVPTVLSVAVLQQLTAEQIVDIPVPGRDGGGARGGLQGFSPRTGFSSIARRADH